MNQAGLYSKANGVQKTDATYVLENYIRLVRWRKDGLDNILDLGCGSGNVTMDILYPLLPIQFEKLTGADLSENMIEYAKNLYKKKKVEFIQLDIMSKNLPVELDGSYDHIFSFYCLHWIQDQLQAFKNMYDLLKPGGDILLTFLAHHPIYTIYETMYKGKWGKYMNDLKYYVTPYQNSENPEKECDGILRKAGFSVHLCKVVDREYTYCNLETVAKAMCAVNPFIKRIPDNERNDYVETYLDEVRQGNFIENSINNNEEKVHVPYKLFIIFASKPQ